MMQLSFQPAFDVFHTAFRFLRLRRLMTEGEKWHYDQLRIADYYLLFFYRLANVRLESRHRSIKKMAINSPSGRRYEHQPDDHFIFMRMKEIQKAAIKTLALDGYFDPGALESNNLLASNKVEPQSLNDRIAEINLVEKDVMDAINVLITEYELSGSNGLKHRTGLLEYRYDAV